MTVSLRIGARVSSAAHRLTGEVRTFSGTTAHVELPDGTLVPLPIADLQVDEPPPPARPAQPAAGRAPRDLPRFARALHRRLSGQRGDEAVYLRALAEAYLEQRGEVP